MNVQLFSKTHMKVKRQSKHMKVGNEAQEAHDRLGTNQTIHPVAEDIMTLRHEFHEQPQMTELYGHRIPYRNEELTIALSLSSTLKPLTLVLFCVGPSLF
jgi:hypothetical protein